MNRNWFAMGALVVAGLALLNASSCARSRKLVGITVTPQGPTITLTAPGQVVSTQFTALGAYIHPPETRDVTNIAVWTTDSPSIISANPNTPGEFSTTGNGCGTNLGITASVYSDPADPSAGSVILGTSTMSVKIGTICQ
ncbi:MAG TPA: hypothetical protein VKA07_14730 [Candidatus Sulfotelmatobacter sp.]|nr:hypothetical protein [Candidatus Sulfotelmatobacter sp.]